MTAIAQKLPASQHNALADLLFALYLPDYGPANAAHKTTLALQAWRAQAPRRPRGVAYTNDGNGRRAVKTVYRNAA